MQEDDRCCGTGTCIIDAQGHCWCGQQWNGVKMCRPEKADLDALKAYDFVPLQKQTNPAA